MGRREDRGFVVAWGVLSVVVAGLAAHIAVSEHRCATASPATCIVDQIVVEQISATRFRPIERVAVKSGDALVGRYLIPLRDAEGETMAQARARGEGRRGIQPTFDCYYDPDDRTFITLEHRGHYELPIAFSLLSVALVVMCVLSVRSSRRRLAAELAEQLGPRKPSRGQRLFDARRFLPQEPPEGWSPPMAVRRSHKWQVKTDLESMALVLERQRWMWVVKVAIGPLTGKTPVSDARCLELLSHLRDVGELIEVEGGRSPETRTWLAVAPGRRPVWPVPSAPPSPPPLALSPHLVAARKYLPQKLPAAWSVPVAITADHGTGWKDGAWMIGTADEELMLITLVTSNGRVKLSVSIFYPDGEDVSEGSAVELLRHFRGVLEFAQTEPILDEGVRIRAYLGELAPEGRTHTALN